MVIFSLKLLNNLRKAIAGRRFPHQLAGGVALGVLLGIIPHGNLLAVFVLLTVLCFRVNHAMMGVVAIAVSFCATGLDSYSHSVGEFLLTHPTGSTLAAQAWSLPLVPWTDLNNTVVLGSLTIGVGAVLPIFAVTLPIFRLIAPAVSDSVSEDDATATFDETAPAVAYSSNRTDTGHSFAKPTRYADGLPKPESSTRHSVSLLAEQQKDVPPPRFASRTEKAERNDVAISEAIRIERSSDTAPVFIPIDDEADAVSDESKTTSSDVVPTPEKMVSVETRIDVIRMKDFRTDESPSTLTSADGAETQPEQPMDEALNYLLHQLRNSQQRKAAG